MATKATKTSKVQQQNEKVWQERKRRLADRPLQVLSNNTVRLVFEVTEVLLVDNGASIGDIRTRDEYSEPIQILFGFGEDAMATLVKTFQMSQQVLVEHMLNTLKVENLTY